MAIPILGKLFGAGVKEAVTGIAEGAKDVINAWNGPKEIKEQAIAKLDELKQQHEDLALIKGVEIETAYLADTQSARTRETEFVKATGHFDWMMWFLALTGVGVFGYMIWILVNKVVPEANKDLISHGLGIIEGVVIAIFSYYFGSSAGSRLKDMKPKS